MKSKVWSKAIALLTIVAAFSMVPLQSDAQLLDAVVKGGKALKGVKDMKKWEPMRQKAEKALQSGDVAFLISDECMNVIPAQANKINGKALEDWNDLDKRIKEFLYGELHTIDQANYCENIKTLIGKASEAESTEVKALYVDAAIGVMKAMIAFNYDVASNREAVEEAYNSVKAAREELPDTYKPFAGEEDADIKDPRFLHNLKGDVPNIDDIIAYQEKLKAQAAEEVAKKEAAAAEAAANRAAAEAADAEKRKSSFAQGSRSCGFFVYTQKPGTANLEKVDVLNIASGTSNININAKNGVSSIGKFVLDGNQYKVYKGSSLIGYITEDWQFLDSNKNLKGSFKNGKAYDKNGYTLGEISSTIVKCGNYKWNSTSSISTPLFPAAVFIFFGKDFSSYIQIKDYYAK